MNVVEVLEGFDAREDWLDPQVMWPLDRRRLYLLRTECPKPLSTDVWVWRSVFDLDQNATRARKIRDGYLWKSLHDIEQDLYLMWEGEAKPCRIVAITKITMPDKSGAGVPGEGVRSLAEQKPEWLFLGYDVSDDGYLSGLMNCGYVSEDSADTLRSRWGPRLNDNHLFDDLSDAAEFCALTNERVKEHAPFYVYGLWVVKQIAGGSGKM